MGTRENLTKPPAGVRERYERYLSANGYSDTRQRREILEEIYRQRRHFDVEDLIGQLRGRRLKVSRATVYRTIGHLEESGLIRKLGLDDDHAHYEITFGPAHHEHLVCEKCGRIVEIYDPDLERQLGRILRDNGFSKVAGHTVEIAGICCDCREGSRMSGERNR